MTCLVHTALTVTLSIQFIQSHYFLLSLQAQLPQVEPLVCNVQVLKLVFELLLVICLFVSLFVSLPFLIQKPSGSPSVG